MVPIQQGYDFYGYITAGMLMLFAVDLTFLNGMVFLRPQWTTVQVILVLSAAYVVGQIASIPSSAILEMYWCAGAFSHR